MMAANKNQKKIYFTAGPAKIPDEVMQQVHRELLDYNNMGISVLEMSHRSKEFDNIITESEANLRKLMNVPENYAILFMHGGAKTQFDSTVLNLCSSLGEHSLDYIITGLWSKMAASEAEKYAKVTRQQFASVPSRDELKDNQEASFRYYCDNETIQGVEFRYVPETGNKLPLVCDMTSNFLTRPVDVSKFGCIFAGAQKNCGIAGLCIVIVRKDLVGKQMAITPTIQNYKIIHENRSLYNTPLTFAIYIANLCFKWMLTRGGLTEMARFCQEKSGLVYDAIDNSGGFYTNPVAKDSRSRTNVVFLLAKKELDTKFLEEAKEANLYDLKGHRSVGGFRVSLYHGISIEDTKRLVEFLNDFRQKYSV